MGLGPEDSALQPTGENVQSDEGQEGSPDFDTEDFAFYEDDQEIPRQRLEADLVDASGKPLNRQSVNDLLLNAELLLPQGDSEQFARVVRRAVDENGNLVGTFNNKPALNTLVYEVEFPDGTLKHYSANIIAENILQQVDPSGHHSHTLQGIIEARKGKSAVGKDNAFMVTQSGQRRLRQTTMGWDLRVQWRDGTVQWVPLKLMKESNPVEVAEFAVARGLEKEPAFAWWVPYTLKKRDRIIASINSRVRKRSHKYGIEIPTSIEHAKEIDKRNGNTHWQDAVAKEMYNVSVAFKIMEDDKHLPVGYT